MSTLLKVQISETAISTDIFMYIRYTLSCYDNCLICDIFVAYVTFFVAFEQRL